jgi:hypothetical protein
MPTGKFLFTVAEWLFDYALLSEQSEGKPNLTDQL